MLHTHCHGAKGSPEDQIGYGIKLFAPHNSVKVNLSSTCISPCPVPGYAKSMVYMFFGQCTPHLGYYYLLIYSRKEPQKSNSYNTEVSY